MDSALLEQDSSYGYRPTLYICIIYVVLFSSTLGLHFYQMVASRYWFLAPTVLLAAFLEVVGWVGRLWSNKNLFLDSPFMMQICCLIIGPTPLLAANFVVFGRLVSLLGTEYSRLRPNYYSYIFLGCDILSLVLQGAGGGIASSADPGTSALDAGTNLMIAGIALQVAMMAVFVVLVAEYTLRYIYDKPLKGRGGAGGGRFPLDTRRQVALFAMGSTTVLLFIRGIYRLIELSGGWNSTIMHTEWLFNVFDAAVVLLAFAIWNVAHPSILLDIRSKDAVTTEKVQSGHTSENTLPEVEA